MNGDDFVAVDVAQEYHRTIMSQTSHKHTLPILALDQYCTHSLTLDLETET